MLLSVAFLHYTRGQDALCSLDFSQVSVSMLLQRRRLIFNKAPCLVVAIMGHDHEHAGGLVAVLRSNQTRL